MAGGVERGPARAKENARGVPVRPARAEESGDDAARSSDETREAMRFFFSLLDERQRRVFAGLESMRFGRGGDGRIAELTDLAVNTVAKGRKELAMRDVELHRIRKPGAGRKRIEKKRPR